MVVVGCGAMNLDLIYKVEDITKLYFKDIELCPGREIVISHELAKELLKMLEMEGMPLGKSGGGSAANTICALSELGHECYFISSVGEDEFGDFLINQMNRVDCSFVKRYGKSSICIIVIDEKTKDRSMVVVPGSLDVDIEREDLKLLLNKTDLFHFTSFVQKKGPFIQTRLLELLQREALVSFDPGEVYAKVGYEPLKTLFSMTDLLFSTDYEINSFFNGYSEKDILKKVLRKGKKDLSRFHLFKECTLPLLIKKKGAKGAEAFCMEKKINISAKKVKEIIDNTGAGDAFSAGVLHGILKGGSLREALEQGANIAAFSLAYPGRKWIEHIKKI